MNNSKLKRITNLKVFKFKKWNLIKKASIPGTFIDNFGKFKVCTQLEFEKNVFSSSCTLIVILISR